jgi:hypothetical protein
MPMNHADLILNRIYLLDDVPLRYVGDVGLLPTFRSLEGVETSVTPQDLPERLKLPLPEKPEKPVK